MDYVIPKEGAGTLRHGRHPQDAEHKDAAYQFMNFLMQPEIMAEITNAVRFPNGNQAATRWSTKTSPATRASTRLPT